MALSWKSLTSDLVKCVRLGYEYVTLVAQSKADVHLQPYVQVAWRDDMRMQLEGVGSAFASYIFSDQQVMKLKKLGFEPPNHFGEDFPNWTQFREGEGTEPNSVARLLVQTLREVYVDEIKNFKFEFLLSDNVIGMFEADYPHRLNLNKLRLELNSENV